MVIQKVMINVIIVASMGIRHGNAVAKPILTGTVNEEKLLIWTKTREMVSLVRDHT